MTPPLQPGTGLPPLGPGSILLLRCTLDPGPDVSTLLDSVLTREERTRAAGLRLPAVNRRFRATRGWTRVVLGKYLNEAPERIVFTRSPEGKPGIEGGPSFNLTHTGEHLVVALAAEGALGVDAEEGRRLRDLEGLAARIFTPMERDQLLEVPEGPAREAAFFRGWTRKEALVKAMGRGLTLPLQRISVELLRAEGPLLRWVDPLLEEGTGGTPTAWTVVDASRAAPGSGAAAVAWDRPVVSLETREVPRGSRGAAWIRAEPV